jgi:hypothetical protein
MRHRLRRSQFRDRRPGPAAAAARAGEETEA